MTALDAGRAEYPELVAAAADTDQIVSSIPDRHTQEHLRRVIDALGGAHAVGAAELLLSRFGHLGAQFRPAASWDSHGKTVRLQLEFRREGSAHLFVVLSHPLPVSGGVVWRAKCGLQPCSLHTKGDTISGPELGHVLDWVAEMAEACVPGLFDPPATSQPERDVVPQNLRQLRNVRGLTVEDLAERVGVDPSVIREAEASGVFDVTIDPIQRLAEALCTSRAALTRDLEETET